MARPLTIGLVARAASVNIETVRYYQRFGIIDKPKKPKQGYRVYSNKTIARIRFIKRAQQLGFSLKEIAELLDFGSGHCADVRRHAEQKRKQIDAQITDLKKLRKTLDKLIATCQNNKASVHCPIVETLAK